MITKSYEKYSTICIHNEIILLIFPLQHKRVLCLAGFYALLPHQVKVYQLHLLIHAAKLVCKSLSRLKKLFFIQALHLEASEAFFSTFVFASSLDDDDDDDKVKARK